MIKKLLDEPYWAELSSRIDEELGVREFVSLPDYGDFSERQIDRCAFRVLSSFVRSLPSEPMFSIFESEFKKNGGQANEKEVLSSVMKEAILSIDLNEVLELLREELERLKKDPLTEDENKKRSSLENQTNLEELYQFVNLMNQQYNVRSRSPLRKIR